MPEFTGFPKLARLSREIVITEKLDGTNSAVVIQPLAEHDPSSDVVAISGDFAIFAQSRSRLIWPGKSTDNFGFAGWVRDNAEELVRLGPGVHFGEWYGQGIQRNYGLKERLFALFNVGRWARAGAPLEHEKQCHAPACCDVVPILYRGGFWTNHIQYHLDELARDGSRAVPGFMDPEGIVIFHSASGTLFKKTIKDDEVPKAVAEQMRRAA